MIKCEKNTQPQEEEEDYSKYTIEDLKKMFVRKLPYDDENYYRRLEHELYLLSQKNLICYLIQAIDIMKLTKRKREIPIIYFSSPGSWTFANRKKVLFIFFSQWFLLINKHLALL